jgi:hypothetical protein
MNRAHLTRRTFTLGGTLALATPLLKRALDPESVLAATPTWQQLAADRPGPVARFDHTLAADDEAKQLILFGGRDANYTALNDTWLFDLDARTWTQIDGDGPAPRFGQAVAVDPSARRLYLFGGQNQDTFFNDTWQFDLQEQRWDQIDTGEGTAPSPRYGLGAVLDPTGNLFVSHGFTFEGRFDDTWSFGLADKTWTDASPVEGERPLKRCLHEMVWMPTAERILLYGGCSSGFGPCPQGDLWSYLASERRWTNITPSDGPAARSNPSLVWDDRTDRAYLFGGLTESGHANDLWSGTASAESFTWSLIETSDTPAPRASHDAVISAGYLYLFGGTSPAATYNDLLRLKLPR